MPAPVPVSVRKLSEAGEDKADTKKRKIFSNMFMGKKVSNTLQKSSLTNVI